MKPQHALGALIEDAIQRNHWTQESVAERARSSGFRMSTQNLSRIKNSPVTTLVPEQVRAVAAGLQLPVSVVLAATLESLGFTGEPLRQPGVEEAVKYDHRLSARDRRILAAVVTELLSTDDEKAGAEHDQRSAPMNNADAASATPESRKTTRARGDRVGVTGEPSKVHTLIQPDQAADVTPNWTAHPGTPGHPDEATDTTPAPPANLAARDVGRPSRGQQLAERQDADGERPDPASQ